MYRKVLAILLVIGSTSASGQWLPAVMEQALEKAGIGSDALAFSALPIDGTGQPLWHQPDKLLQPGSTMKLVTTVGALAHLGPNYRARTRLLIDGTVHKNELRGDVILRGQADPDLDVPALWELLYRLRAEGVLRIRGNVVLDRGYFAPERMDTGIAPFDESPEFQYNVIPDALNINGSLLRFEMKADAKRVRVRTLPPLWGIEVRSEQVVAEGKCKDWDDSWTPARVHVSTPKHRATITLNGRFPAHCIIQSELQLLDRDLVANRLIRQLWADMGGRLDGRVITGRAPESARPVTEHVARPLAEVIRHMNKASDNPLTRLVFLSIGAQAPAEFKSAYTSTAAASAARIQQWFSTKGIAPEGMVFDNGSGLSRTERISPQQMVRMLDVAYRSPWAPEFVASLPLVGVDGTMRNRLKGTKAEGRARIKTGTLRNVVAVAGYVWDADERLWAVSAMINHEEKSESGRPVLDALLEWIASNRSEDIGHDAAKVGVPQEYLLRGAGETAPLAP